MVSILEVRRVVQVRIHRWYNLLVICNSVLMVKRTHTYRHIDRQTYIHSSCTTCLCGSHLGSPHSSTSQYPNALQGARVICYTGNLSNWVVPETVNCGIRGVFMVRRTHTSRHIVRHTDTAHVLHVYVGLA